MSTHYIVSELLLLICLPRGLITTNSTDSITSAEPETRIIGGEDVAEGEYPFVVLVASDIGRCTGSIIHKDWVLTAAHCLEYDDKVNKGDVTIIAGTIHYTQNTANRVKVKSKRAFTHSSYTASDTKIENDVALIEVRTSFDFSGCCVKMVRITSGLFPGVITKSCTAVGFGKTSNSNHNRNEILHKLAVEASVLMECFKRSYWIWDMFDVHPYRSREKSGKLICVAASKGRDTCQGDSGGPLVCEGIVAGTLSHSTQKLVDTTLKVKKSGSCAQYNGISIYFFTGPYIEWIKSYIPDLATPGTLSAATTIATTSCMTFMCLHIARSYLFT